MARIRRLIGINLILGPLTSMTAKIGPYVIWSKPFLCQEDELGNRNAEEPLTRNCNSGL